MNEGWLEPWASIAHLRADAPRYFDQLRYHEAGHAVAAWAWQFDIRYVTLDDGGPEHRSICRTFPRALSCSLCVLAFTFAALEAERRLCQARGWEFDARGPNWFANDREELKEIGQPHRHGAAVLRARRLLALPDAWAAVEAIADALGQAPGYRLSGAEVARICRHPAQGAREGAYLYESTVFHGRAKTVLKYRCRCQVSAPRAQAPDVLCRAPGAVRKESYADRRRKTLEHTQHNVLVRGE